MPKKQAWKSFVVMSIIFVVMIVGVLIASVNSTIIMAKVLSMIVEAKFEDVEVQKVKIEEIIFIPFTQLYVSKVHVQIHRGRKVWVLDIGELRVNDFKTLVIQEFNYHVPGIDYQLEDISTTIHRGSDEILLKDVVANFYGGKVTGDIVFSFDQNYSYVGQFKLNSVELFRLRSVNPGFFSNVNGRVSGYIKFAGAQNGITSLEGEVAALEKGEMKAALLRPLLDYIPQSVQRDDLKRLIKQNGDVPLDKAIIRINSLKKEKLTAQFDLESRKFNLDLDVTVDLNVEGGLDRLFILSVGKKGKSAP